MKKLALRGGYWHGSKRVAEVSISYAEVDQETKAITKEGLIKVTNKADESVICELITNRVD